MPFIWLDNSELDALLATPSVVPSAFIERLRAAEERPEPVDETLLTRARAEIATGEADVEVTEFFRNGRVRCVIHENHGRTGGDYVMGAIWVPEVQDAEGHPRGLAK